MRTCGLLQVTGKCRFLALAILALFLSSCQPTPTGPQPLTDADKEEIQAFLTKTFRKAYLAKDASAMTGFYTEDAIQLPPNTGMVRGKADIQKYFSHAFPSFLEDVNLIDHRETPVEISGVNGLAYVVSMSRRTVTPPGSDSPQTFTGKSVLVLKKQADGSWKIAADIWNSDQPQPTPE